MCKPSQVFNFGPTGVIEQVLLRGAGVLTDLITPALGIAGAYTLILRDGPDQNGKPLISLTVTSAVAIPPTPYNGMNLEFHDGLFLDYTPTAPVTGDITVGAYIQDISPDPMAIQQQRIADALLALDRSLREFAMFKKGLEEGNPST